MSVLKQNRLLQLSLLLLNCFLFQSDVFAFCGFYVAKADSSLYNKASQVVLARHEDKTVISMMNDYQGELTNFALVVPVPEILQEGQINVGDRKLFDRIDAFSAPRLVEYFDPDPCLMMRRKAVQALAMPEGGAALDAAALQEKSHGVTVEAEYTIGEYDIVILSAKESSGLENWLIENEYNIPRGARQALAPYIKQDMKFFVAKVNLKEQAKTGLKYLRPLQFAFRSPKFMLPIRLGMINANGPQEILLYVLTKEGRVETTNYRTMKLPTGMDIPVYVKDEFGRFYNAMFDNLVEREGMKTVFTEYVWNMGWCDPCAADPLSPEELKQLGVFWLDQDSPSLRYGQGGSLPTRSVNGPLPVMVTRLHLRYTKETFPEDLVLQETSDSQNFQGRYVLRHPWKGEAGKCEEAKRYFENLASRQATQAQTLANLTGWNINDIREKMSLASPATPTRNDSWWENLWK